MDTVFIATMFYIGLLVIAVIGHNIHKKNKLKEEIEKLRKESKDA